MKKLFLVIVVTVTTSSYADSIKYRHMCTSSQGVSTFELKKCPKSTWPKGKMGYYRPTNPITYMSAPKYEATQPNESVVHSRRYESNELIDSQKRKEAESQAKWDSLGHVGVTPYNSPNTYYHTKFAQR